MRLYLFLTGNHDRPDKKSKATEQVKIQISNYDDEENKHHIYVVHKGIIITRNYFSDGKM